MSGESPIQSLAPLRSLEDILREMLEKGWIEEGLGPLIPAVDLSIRYAPVVEQRFDLEPIADVRETVGGGYVLVRWEEDRRGRRHPDARVVDPALLTVMRARFLWRHGILNDMLMRDHYRLKVPYWVKDWVIRTYFDGAWFDLSSVIGARALQPETDELRTAWESIPLPCR